MVKKPETTQGRPDRSDYFTWEPGDLVPVTTPMPSPEERLQALLAKLPAEGRAKVEAILARDRGKGG
jgi:hypothetical protein